MFSGKRYFISLTLILLSFYLPAQDLTGTWEGALSNDQFLQLNIIQTGDKICGYTFDHVKADERSFCKAFFEGRFDRKRKVLILDGKYFLKNSGTHTLMQLRLDYKMEKGVEVLEQNPFPAASEYESPFLKRIDSMFSRLQSFLGIEESVDSSGYVYIKKVSDQPYELIDLMKDCIARDKKETDPVIVPSTDSMRPVVKIIKPENPKDSITPPVVIAPVEQKSDSSAVPKTLEQRKNKVQKHIVVNVHTINLKVYDNAIIDGDTVSIMYNGKMLFTHQLLSEKGIELNIELDENQTRNELVLFAENLGSIPPNTALIVVTAGKKRYELFASANLEENAVLVFEYKPE